MRWPVQLSWIPEQKWTLNQRMCLLPFWIWHCTGVSCTVEHDPWANLELESDNVSVTFLNLICNVLYGGYLFNWAVSLGRSVPWIWQCVRYLLNLILYGGYVYIWGETLGTSGPWIWQCVKYLSESDTEYGLPVKLSWRPGQIWTFNLIICLLPFWIGHCIEVTCTIELDPWAEMDFKLENVSVTFLDLTLYGSFLYSWAGSLGKYGAWIWQCFCYLFGSDTVCGLLVQLNWIPGQTWSLNLTMRLLPFLIWHCMRVTSTV